MCFQREAISAAAAAAEKKKSFAAAAKRFSICIGGLIMNQSKGSTVALHQLWLALKPTCAFSVGGLVSLGRHVHVPF